MKTEKKYQLNRVAFSKSEEAELPSRCKVVGMVLGLDTECI